MQIQWLRTLTFVTQFWQQQNFLLPQQSQRSSFQNHPLMLFYELDIIQTIFFLPQNVLYLIQCLYFELCTSYTLVCVSCPLGNVQAVTLFNSLNNCVFSCIFSCVWGSVLSFVFQTILYFIFCTLCIVTLLHFFNILCCIFCCI